MNTPLDVSLLVDKLAASNAVGSVGSFLAMLLSQ